MDRSHFGPARRDPISVGEWTLEESMTFSRCDGFALLNRPGHEFKEVLSASNAFAHSQSPLAG
jgi:hypothetical protein